MNKVLLLSDVEQLPASAFQWACMLNEEKPILLTGVFLTTANYMDMLLYYSGGLSAPVYYSLNGETVVIANEAISQFKKACIQNGIDFRVHEKQHFEVKKELERETRFADLLLFTNDAFYETLGSDIYDDYAYDTLHNAECPVLIVPDVFNTPERLILAYDGSPSSVYAIKQFAALFSRND